MYLCSVDVPVVFGIKSLSLHSAQISFQTLDRAWFLEETSKEHHKPGGNCAGISAAVRVYWQSIERYS